MGYEPKILLTIELEGGTLIKGESEERSYTLLKKDLFASLKHTKQGNKVAEKGVYKHTPVYSKPAYQKIKMSYEAYKYMCSPECPKWFKNVKMWRKLTEETRLEHHLSRTCEHFGGKSYTYVIFDD